jgi:hypothetical protein
MGRGRWWDVTFLEFEASRYHSWPPGKPANALDTPGQYTGQRASGQTVRSEVGRRITQVPHDAVPATR